MKSKLIKEIIFTFIFMIISTLFIYLPKNEELASSLMMAANMRSLTFDLVSNDIIMDQYYPVSDAEGLEFTDNIFRITNNSNTSKNYEIKFKTGNKNVHKNLVENKNIRYTYKINDGEYSKPATLADDGVISVETIEGNTENIYYFKFWISAKNNSEIDGRVIQGMIELNA